MPRDLDGSLTPGRVSPLRPVPSSIARPEYVGKAGPAPYTGGDVYDAATIELIRTSGRIASQAIDAVEAAMTAGAPITSASTAAARVTMRARRGNTVLLETRARSGLPSGTGVDER